MWRFYLEQRTSTGRGRKLVNNGDGSLFRRQLITLAIMALVVTPCSALHSQVQSGHPEIDRLHAEFSRGRGPRKSELLGRWILVKQVDSEQFQRGRGSGELVIADKLGVRDSSAGHPYYWELHIAVGADGQLRATSETPWTGREVSVMSFDPDGALSFTKDYGGDSPYSYRCRLIGGDRLICFWKDKNPQHAVEFRRQRAPEVRKAQQPIGAGV